MKNRDQKLIHDIKNKLFVIQHHFKKIKTGAIPKSEESIQLSLDRCLELIEDYYKETEQAPELDTFTLEEIIAEGAIPHYEKLEKMYNIKIIIEYDIEADGKSIKGNEAQFKKVRENIVENAVNAQASYLKVSITGREDYLQIIYENDGNPISDELLNAINSYSEGNNKSESQGTGTKIIKEVCADHGFNIHYEKTDQNTTKIIIRAPYSK